MGPRPRIKRHWYLGTTHELGRFLVVEEVEVGIEYRRKGVGKATMEVMLEEAKDRGAEHAFLWPTQLNSAPDAARGTGTEAEALFEKNKKRSIAFF